jgi:hypothetical protein
MGVISSIQLLLEAFDLRRQKAMQAQLASLLLRERRAFIQPLVVKEVHPAKANGHGWLLHLWCSHSRRLLRGGLTSTVSGDSQSGGNLIWTLQGCSERANSARRTIGPARRAHEERAARSFEGRLPPHSGMLNSSTCVRTLGSVHPVTRSLGAGTDSTRRFPRHGKSEDGAARHARRGP